jgi:hypothetical protein
MADRRQPRPQRRRRVGIEGIGLGLHRPARAGVPPTRIALRHEAPCPHGAAGGQEMVRRLGTQSVGHREEAVGVPHIHRPGQRRELMDDHLRLGLAHHPSHGIGIESVGDNRPRPQRPQPILLRRGPGHGHNLVASGDQLGDQLCAQRTRSPGNENLHGNS